MSNLQARCYHRAAAFSLADELTEVTIFGGCPEVPSTFKTDADLRPLAETTVLVLTEWVCWDMLHV